MTSDFCCFKSDNLRIDCYILKIIDSRMYILQKEKNLFIIDPFPVPELIDKLQQTEMVYVFLTHEHFDHISGVQFIQEYTYASIYASTVCGEYVQCEKKNRIKQFPLLFLKDQRKYDIAKKMVEKPCFFEVNNPFDKTLTLNWLGDTVKMYASPGHSPGSSMLLYNNRFLFSGDSLLGNGKELQSIGSSIADYQKYVVDWVNALNDSITVFPGHGNMHQLKWFIERIKV